MYIHGQTILATQLCNQTSKVPTAVSGVCIRTYVHLMHVTDPYSIKLNWINAWQIMVPLSNCPCQSTHIDILQFVLHSAVKLARVGLCGDSNTYVPCFIHSHSKTSACANMHTHWLWSLHALLRHISIPISTLKIGYELAYLLIRETPVQWQHRLQYWSSC